MFVFRESWLRMASVQSTIHSDESSPVLGVAGRGASRSAERQQLILHSLAGQQELTVVGRFSQLHDEQRNRTAYYRDLIPLSAPAASQQYAFEVDLDKCSGCKACVTACHSLNGLSDGESWREVGQLVGLSAELPIVQHVTSACHHCLEPACLQGCPTNAYEKDQITGIVRHWDDQCFGCQYCVMACPYEVPRYNAERGIVRKCDLCHGRLAAGEAPACVQACPSQAIQVTLVDQATARAAAEHGEFLPGAPPPKFTLPTTRFTSRATSNRTLSPVDAGIVAPQHVHAPLVAMLVLTQWSVGTLTWCAVGGSLAFASGAPTTIGMSIHLLYVAAITAGLGLVAALGHLGRPWLAFRGVLGWRHSWLSREVMAFGAYFPCVALLTIASTWGRLAPGSQLLEQVPARWLVLTVAWFGVAWGWAGVFCSVRLYQFTQRPFWIQGGTSVKFVLTALWLGTASQWIVAGPTSRWIGASLMAMAAGKLVREAWFLWRYRAETAERDQEDSERDAEFAERQRASAALQLGPLRMTTYTRFVCGVVGGLLLPLVALVTALFSEASGGNASEISSWWLAGTVTSLCLSWVAELCERRIFFQAVVPWRMPGRGVS